MDPRHERFFPHSENTSATSKFNRDWAERDRDRILYCSAFRRLAGVTQVVGPIEGHVFHNRLTHTLKVAQLARRLAQQLVADHGCPFVHPECAEAAGLAHDLGHPPFGHAAEKELNRLAVENGAEDGFEGNAQSFRILVHSSAHQIEKKYRGLNLTRATLNATLKYPHIREDRRRKKAHEYEKYGAYDSDEEQLEWVRKYSPKGHGRSMEAAIMDHADNIAYSVHDLEDFTRAGLIPIANLRYSDLTWQDFIDTWKADPKADAIRTAIDANADSFRVMLQYMVEQYSGTFDDRARTRKHTSGVINEYVYSMHPKNPSDEFGGIAVDPEARIRMKFLQRLVWHYVIFNPRLGSVQEGQRRIVKELFRVYLRAVKTCQLDLIPPFYREEVKKLGACRVTKNSARHTRVAVDIIAGFTDQEAITMYRSLTGHSEAPMTQLTYQGR